MTKQELIDKGYCVTSRRFGIVSKIDRSDWKEYMAEKHSPWSVEEGLRWVECLGNDAEDHYRRCYSQDQIEFGSYSRVKGLPKSHTTITGFRE